MPGAMASAGEILLSSAPARAALFTRIIASVDGGADDEFSADAESGAAPARDQPDEQEGNSWRGEQSWARIVRRLEPRQKQLSVRVFGTRTRA